MARERGGSGRGRNRAGRAGSVAGGAIRRPGSGEGRQPRTSIPLGDKISLIEIKDAGHSWAQTLAMFSLNISPSDTRHIYRKRSEYKMRAAA